ncbi:3-hydroxyacyl-CoA dehydrogenase NAD-binding domain-containing protein [Thiohalophilus thiocyanatoxydans]|uniref:enoyl-CoA hydratase n=1 Tax=Thiohalophilus thiocyanatoxydans TaxID=381308 RepID=A0A4R8IY79_9GAMM|nr:3-hydroxyacyl-CoA dehydrogenase NAD-binding domain-containing protein [Thiohalophilus thiocyanatoxydans]TDY02887.1 short chain enoyl-CoA hydratase /3-hydroxyacyl-CoA dehydrogenase [Thiohalophilus thiocyanatoxydans]
MATTNYQNWHVVHDEQHIAWLHLDKANSSTNTLSADVLNELDEILNQLLSKPPRGVILLSDKSNGFIAGADVKEFTEFNDQGEAQAAIERGHTIVNKLEHLPCPTVALIHGFCLGGGLELSLACRYRIADEDPATRIGLPEVKLGIHPGFGGTVRSIETLGPLNALDLMLTGRTLSARAAKRMKLIQHAVPKRHLLNAATRTVLHPPAKQTLPFWMPWLNHKWLRPWLAKYMAKKVAAKAPRAHYPAPYALLDLWQNHFDDRQQMLKEEALSVARLIVGKTARNLVRVFQLQEQMKSLGRQIDYAPKQVHVIGAGVMGGDIAAWCAMQGFQVTIQDQKTEAIGRVIKAAHTLYKSKLKARIAINGAMDRLIPDPHGHGLKRADIVIEAIFEDVQVKQDLLRDIEPKLPEHALIATNTSSIPLEKLATALNKPQRLVGLHFFNPVAKMPLVEIVHGQQTSEESVNQAGSFTKSIRKLPLPVASKPGFLVNRVLMPYLMEAVTLADEGIPLKVIDDEAVKFGMPMGPIELADTVGLDICLKVAEILSESMEIQVPEALRTLVNKGNLGKKSGQGFYTFKKGKPVKPKPDKSYTPPADIQDRMILRLINEAVACLRDKVIDDADLADAGVIFGTGFAPFRGGPLQYANSRGYEQVEKMLSQLQQRYGPRFTPDSGWSQFH